MAERWQHHSNPEDQVSSSVADILAALDRGEIVRGDKGDRKITIGNDEYTYYPYQGIIRFLYSGVTIEVAIKTDQTIDTIRLSESDTGKTIFDRPMTEQVQDHITTLIQQGYFDKN